LNNNVLLNLFIDKVNNFINGNRKGVQKLILFVLVLFKSLHSGIKIIIDFSSLNHGFQKSTGGSS